jgi:hypothetical protein
VVLHPQRRAEDAHHRIADVLVEAGPVLQEHRAHPGEVGVEHADQALRVLSEPLAEGAEALDVGEEGGDLDLLTGQPRKLGLGDQLLHHLGERIAAEHRLHPGALAVGVEVVDRHRGEAGDGPASTGTTRATCTLVQTEQPSRAEEEQDRRDERPQPLDPDVPGGEDQQRRAERDREGQCRGHREGARVMKRPPRSAASSVAGFTTPTGGAVERRGLHVEGAHGEPGDEHHLAAEEVGSEKRRLAALAADRVVDHGDEAPGIEALPERSGVVEPGAAVRVDGDGSGPELQLPRGEHQPVGPEQVRGERDRERDVPIGSVGVGEAGAAQLPVRIRLRVDEPERGHDVEKGPHRGDGMAHGPRRAGQVHREGRGAARPDWTGKARTLATSSGVGGASVPSGGAKGSSDFRRARGARCSTVQFRGVTPGSASPF